MRTTVSIDDELLAQARLIAAGTHRTIGSVLEDALRRLIHERSLDSQVPFELPRFSYQRPGLREGIDLLDREQLTELLGDNDYRSI
ncbi:MAG: type II toxin-antitoxin system VapB family antitoxin [Actinomycetota bacterium]|nr:type II toxin-antitoxin system VapB family antitoxin [Actinomycetota bacterium]